MASTSKCKSHVTVETLQWPLRQSLFQRPALQQASRRRWRWPPLLLLLLLLLWLDHAASACQTSGDRCLCTDDEGTSWDLSTLGFDTHTVLGPVSKAYCILLNSGA